MTGYTYKLDLATLGSSYYPDNHLLAPYRHLIGRELVFLLFFFFMQFFLYYTVARNILYST